MTNNQIKYGPIRTPEELGQITRVHRKCRGISLETVSGLGNLGIRFLSEFERGKKTAEIGKVLKALDTLGLELVVRPRRTLPLTNFKSSVATVEEVYEIEKRNNQEKKKTKARM